jgi:hypothetical protein
VWHSARPPRGGKSLANAAEVELVCAAAAALRARHPSASIAVLTFYRGQLGEIMARRWTWRSSRSTPARAPNSSTCC